MPTYHDLENDRKRDEKFRQDASYRKATRHLTDPEGQKRDQDITRKNRTTAMIIGKELGLSEEQAKQHILDNFSPNRDIQFSDKALSYAIEYMVKAAK